jgi:hypothetical protein
MLRTAGTCAVLAASLWLTACSSSPTTPIGFFSGLAVDPSFVPHVALSKIEARPVGDRAHPTIDLPYLEQSLRAADDSPHRVAIDLGLVLADTRPANSLSPSCLTGGQLHAKDFSALATNKLRVLPPDEEIERRLTGLGPVLARHLRNLGPIFIVDEPYLNGVPRRELERAGAAVRRVLLASDVRVELGVIFASAMFDAGFARKMDDRACGYAASIDAYYEQNRIAASDSAGTPEALAFSTWVSSFQTQRITTYDTAGNMFVDGGLPAGFSIVAFDFYASTLIYDLLHDDTLSWFAEHTSVPECRPFRGSSMTELRSQLSFFGGPKPGVDDAPLLDALFVCRMKASLELLDRQVMASGQAAPKLMLIGESSSNGVLDVDPTGRPLAVQNPARVEQRALQEVERTLSFYFADPERFRGGLLFFTFANVRDGSIGLDIGGASAMPTVLDRIYQAAQTGR